jgi:hypothetical protein
MGIYSPLIGGDEDFGTGFGFEIGYSDGFETGAHEGFYLVELPPGHVLIHGDAPFWILGKKHP